MHPQRPSAETLADHLDAALEIGADPINLTNSPYANDFQPAWTPDSQRLIYVSYTAAKGDHDLWSMRRDGSDARVLVEDARDDLAPNWRPTGAMGAASTVGR